MQDLRVDRKGRILAVKDLPTLPAVLDEVTKLIQDPSSSTEQVAGLISQDQVLSAKVLKMVNSPIYGFPRRISTIQHALVLLGLNVIRGLIISTSVFDVMAKNMLGLWEHSLGCALACSSVAKKAGFKDPEEYSVAGLLHDLGKVVIALQLPEMKEEVDGLVREKDVLYIDAENEILGFGHDRVNAWLADHWNLPKNIREGLAWHHRPRSAQLYPEMACVVHVADFLARLYETGNSGDDNVSYLRPYALDTLKLKLQDLEQVMDELGEQFMELSSFRPDE